MTFPNEYRRVVSFAQENINNPGEPLNGTKVDSEFDSAGLIINQLIRRLGLIQRDDGKLRNKSVHWGSLSQEVIDFILANGGKGGSIPAEDDDGTVPPINPGTPGSGTAGAVFFRQLLDVKDKTFTGHAGKFVRVNASQTALEFSAMPTVVVRWNDLANVQDISDSVAGFVPVVNAAGDALVWRKLPIDLTGKYARLDEGNDWGYYTQEKMRLGTYREKLTDLGNIAGVVSIDPAQGNHFKGVIVGDCNFVLAGGPLPVGSCFSFTLRLQSPGSTYSHTWFPSGTIDWGPGGAPVVSAGSRNYFSFIVYDDGIVAAFDPR